jgi:hypothetical protein
METDVCGPWPTPTNRLCKWSQTRKSRSSGWKRHNRRRRRRSGRSAPVTNRKSRSSGWKRDR